MRTSYEIVNCIYLLLNRKHGNQQKSRNIREPPARHGSLVNSTPSPPFPPPPPPSPPPPSPFPSIADPPLLLPCPLSPLPGSTDSSLLLLLPFHVLYVVQWGPGPGRRPTAGHRALTIICADRAPPPGPLLLQMTIDYHAVVLSTVPRPAGCVCVCVCGCVCVCL